MYLSVVCVCDCSRIFCRKSRVLAEVRSNAGEKSSVEALCLAIGLSVILGGIQVPDTEIVSHESEKL